MSSRLFLICQRTTLRNSPLAVAHNHSDLHSRPPRRLFAPVFTRPARPLRRQLSTSDSTLDSSPAPYHGPLTQTFRRLKLFSLGSLGLTITMSPLLLILESSLPLSGRVSLAALALCTSSLSTALVGWCGAPYVVALRALPADASAQQQGLEMTTLTLALRRRTTRVYDADFLVPTPRPFAKWELPRAVRLPPASDDAVAAGKAGAPGTEETVAETLDERGDVVGRWIVTWGEGGTGTCRGTGRIVRYFNVHEEML